MGSLFTAMVSTADAMSTLQRSLTVVQNNIVNASTVGYARQEASLVANPFNPNSNSTSGGVRSGPMQSSRNSYAESQVWKLQHAKGFADNLTFKLSELERTFPLTAGAGISAELDRFFGSISQWSVAPNSPVARSQVLDRSRKIAQSFNQTALELGNASGQANSELTNTVATINRLARDIVDINVQRRESLVSSGDAGLDARLHAKLEDLATYTNYTALSQEDGSVTVLIGGRTPLVVGDHEFDVTLNQVGSSFEIWDSTGADITRQLTGGRVGSLLEFRNQLLPGYQAELNTLAQGFAGNVNGVLAGGIDLNGNTPAQGLFTYNTTPGAAVTLAVTNITGAELAAAAAGDPGGNTNALDLAGLQTSGVLSGLSFSQFFAGITTRLGDRLNEVRSSKDLQQQLLQQAQNLRAEESGVDINVEATKLLELQRGFQAAGQVISVLNQMTETVMNMVR
ncbi:MAG: flagellar hook-associated protein FlgK [Acidobacteria bacterium]|nr:flagellar hook-associated protein FlgK [Acidobacteriota bacterium]